MHKREEEEEEEEEERQRERENKKNHFIIIIDISFTLSCKYISRYNLAGKVVVNRNNNLQLTFLAATNQFCSGSMCQAHAI